MPAKYTVIIALLLISCKNDRFVEEHYPNGTIKLKIEVDSDGLPHGNYKEFYKNGTLMKHRVYNQGAIVDSSIIYFENFKNTIEKIKYWEEENVVYEKHFNSEGKLIAEGSLFKKDFKIGTWKEYNKEGVLSKVMEYKNINDESYLNQWWNYNEEGEITGGNFYDFKLSEIKENNNIIRFDFLLLSAVKSENTELFLCLPKNNDIKPLFSNKHLIEWDTIPNLSKIGGNPNYEFSTKHLQVIVDIEHESIGQKYLRGFLLEKSTEQKPNKIDLVKRKIYFNIPYLIEN